MKLSLYPVIKVDVLMCMMKKLECATGCSEITSKNKYLVGISSYLYHGILSLKIFKDLKIQILEMHEFYTNQILRTFQIRIFPISKGVAQMIMTSSRVCGIIIICVSASSNPMRISIVIISYISCINLSS